MTRAHPEDRKSVFVTGATGYIGGRLVPRLLDAGWTVRCLARDSRKLADRRWADRREAEVVEGDVADTATLEEQMRGCRFAYYLVHSMVAAGEHYRERDRELVLSFRAAAERAGVERIVYLGGLGETGEGLSEHLASRTEVSKLLADGPIPVTTLRAAMIIGSGSASFEILRYLVERLPIMVTPRWVRTECQPIAVSNVLHYLVAALDVAETSGQTLDIGGSDVVTYQELMQTMAASRGLPRRVILPVPVLTPRLSAGWIHLVTPLSHDIARPLAEGLRNRVVCRDDRATRLMPQRLLTVREAIDEALNAEVHETVWSDAGPIPGDPDWAGGTTFVDRRRVEIAASPNAVFRAVCRIGGGHGWYAADALWQIRGLMDQLVGGPGLRRSRRNPEKVAFGEALDFWRVTDVVKDRRLELRAEMKLPGEALLEFDVEPVDAERTRLVQTARFKPKGLAGLLYWAAVLPFHGFVFRGMLRGIQRTAENLSAKGRTKSHGPIAAHR